MPARVIIPNGVSSVGKSSIEGGCHQPGCLSSAFGGAMTQGEVKRKGCLSGLARWQFGRVHHGIIHDLTIDTSEGTARRNCAYNCDTLRL